MKEIIEFHIIVDVAPSCMKSVWHVGTLFHEQVIDRGSITSLLCQGCRWSNTSPLHQGGLSSILSVGQTCSAPTCHLYRHILKCFHVMKELVQHCCVGSSTPTVSNSPLFDTNNVKPVYSAPTVSNTPLFNINDIKPACSAIWLLNMLF